jgi:hypothetical protein
VLESNIAEEPGLLGYIKISFLPIFFKGSSVALTSSLYQKRLEELARLKDHAESYYLSEAWKIIRDPLPGK